MAVTDSRSGFPSVLQPSLSFLVRWGPFVVPVIYWAVILALQPPDRLGHWETSRDLDRRVYDDYDVTAYALRGINAALGRAPGRIDEPSRGRWDPQTDLDSRYFLEYPHAALGLFQLGYLFPPSVRDLSPPQWVLNANHLSIVEFDPRTHSEPIQLLWRKFRQAIRIYVTLMTACLLGLMVVLEKGYEPGDRLTGPIALLLLPATLYFAANRFDIFPALLTAQSLASLGRKRIVLSAMILGAATMIKVYPALLVFLVIRFLGTNRRSAGIWIGAYAVTLVCFLLPPIWFWGWDATIAPYRYQLSRSMDGMTFYGHLLPEALGESSALGSIFRLSCVLAAVSSMIWTRPQDLAGLLRRGTVVLFVFVSLQVFYSPQWIIWFAPLWLPLVRIHPPLVCLILGLEIVTYDTFPVVYDMEIGRVRDIFFTALIYLRAFFLAAALLALLWWEFGRKKLEAPGIEPGSRGISAPPSTCVAC